MVTMGHMYSAMMVLVLTYIIYKEIISLKRKDEKDKKNIFSWIDKYYFGVFTFSIIPKFFNSQLLKNQIESHHMLKVVFLEYHKLISFLLFISGLLLFVLSLEKN